MVEVRIDEEQLRAAALAQHGPGGDALARAVPALRSGRLGRLAQPERARVEQREAVRTPEHGVEFTLRSAVLAAHAHGFVAGKQLPEVRKLVREHLLRTEEVDAARDDRLGRTLLAETPVVLPVLGVVVSHVESHHMQIGGRLAAAGRHAQRGHEIDQLFHTLYRD